eukprot:11453240-Prorocentrum_lima.AAC.1
MGSETKRCPCGCGGPLRAERLQEHGAFTVLVPRKPSHEELPAGTHATINPYVCGSCRFFLDFGPTT